VANRRKSPRFALKADVFILFRPNLKRIGRLIDVSTGGLAFEYSSFEKDEDVGEVEVDIFADQPRKFLLSRLSCTLVYDINIQQPTFDDIETRRCGIRFKPMSQAEEGILKLFLNKFT